MQKSIMVDEEFHKRLKDKAKRSGATIKNYVEFMEHMADFRLRKAFNDGTIPLPSSAGIPVLDIHMGLNMLDRDVITRQELQIILANYESLGDSLKFCFTDDEAGRAYFEKLALVENYEIPEDNPIPLRK